MLSFAANKVHLTFDTSTSKEAWIASAFPSSVPSDVAKSDGTSADVETEESSGFACAIDLETGNMAVKEFRSGTSTLAFTKSDFSLVGMLKVRVEHKGEPVEAASISINDGKRTVQQLIDASSKGEATFVGLRAGQVRADVGYRSGGESKSLRQSMDVPLVRDTAQTSWIISISDDVTTIPAAQVPSGSTKRPSATDTPGATGAQGVPPQPTKQESMLGKIFSYVIILGLVGAAIVFGLGWLQKNPGKAQTAINKIGIPLPDPGTDPGPTGNLVQPAPIQQSAPEPPQKIILQDAAPTPLSTPVAAAHSGIPRLVADNGQAFNLQEGSNAVGRDASLQIGLPSEGSISRRHAEVQKSGSMVTVRDLGSTNGTFVNGVKVTGEASIRPGDTVQFGTVRFKYEG